MNFEDFRRTSLISLEPALVSLWKALASKEIILSDEQIRFVWSVCNDVNKMKLVSYIGAEPFERLVADNEPFVAEVRQVYAQHGVHEANKLVRDRLGIGILASQSWCKCQKIY